MQVLLIKKDVYSTCLTQVTKKYLKRDTVLLSKNLPRATEVLVLYNKLLLANIIRQYKLSSVWYDYKLIVTRFSNNEISYRVKYYHKMNFYVKRNLISKSRSF